jgi:hypothetical protein
MKAQRTQSIEEAKAAQAELQRYFDQMNHKGYTTLDVAIGIDVATDGTYAVRVNVAKLGAGASQVPKSVNGIPVVVRETGPVSARPVRPLVNCRSRGEALMAAAKAVETLSAQYLGKAGIVVVNPVFTPDDSVVLEVLSTDPDYASAMVPRVWEHFPVVVRESREVVAYDRDDDEVEYSE